MSRELILVTKRKYEDLLKRVGECNDREQCDEVITTAKPPDKHTIIEQEHQLNLSTNNHQVDSAMQTVNDEQIGAGSQPFVKMSFDTFDRIHSKKSRASKKRKWVSFNL